jgi:hypothetical protein
MKRVTSCGFCSTEAMPSAVIGKVGDGDDLADQGAVLLLLHGRRLDADIHAAGDLLAELRGT